MTHIQWTDETWNPIVGCSVISPGCTNCYAMKMAGRLEAIAAATGKPTPYAGTTQHSKAGRVWNGTLRQAPEKTLLAPLRWTKPRRVFVNSMSDLFHENVPDAWIDQVFAVMALCPQHTFQILTKRAGRMRDYVITPRRFEQVWAIMNAMTRDAPLDPIPTETLGRQLHLSNVWLGVSVEDQARANERIPLLLDTPAAVRWISAEPLLGPLDLGNILIDGYEINALNGVVMGHKDGISATNKLNWVVAGGESGKGARPMHPDWARTLRDQCAAAGVPFFFKQWGDWKPISQFPVDEPVYGSHGVLSRSGTFLRNHDVAIGEGESFMFRIGKTAAGDLLDGVQHHNWPETLS
jgi:protein gp37